MPLVKAGRIVEDRFVRVLDDAPVPDGVPVILPAARLLRERHEFRGELRATGQVLRDQLLFLHRAGFDAFEVTKEKDTAAFAEALQRYSIFYQPTGDGRSSALRARLSRGPSSAVPERQAFVR